MNKPVYQNKGQVSLALAVWLATDEYKYAKTANELSATTLLRSPRYIIGTRREMYPEQFDENLRIPVVSNPLLEQLPDIQDKVAARIGTAIHSSVEYAWRHNYKVALSILGYPDSLIQNVLIDPKPEEITPDKSVVYLEQRSYKEVGNWVISGQFDIVIDGSLHDIKSTSTFAWTSGCNDEKYIMQGSIYRWLNPDLITDDHITINFIFTDWNSFRAKADTDYPQFKVMSKRYKLMSIQETDMWVRNKLKTLDKYLNEPIEIIPCCTEKDLFSKPPVYKYYKTGYAEGKRSTKNFDTMAEATAYKAKQGHVGEIVEQRGDPFMCPYCNPLEVEQMMQSVHSNKKLQID